MTGATENEALSNCNQNVDSESVGFNATTPKNRHFKQRPPVLSLPRTYGIPTPPQPPPPQRTRREEKSSSGTTYGASSRRGKRRVHREDRYVTMPFISKSEELADLSVFGIFDGHGGQRAAEFASKRLPELLFRNLSLSANDKHDALRKAFLRTDHEFVSGNIMDNSSFRRTRTSDFSLHRSKSGSRFMALALQSSSSFASKSGLMRSASSTKYDVSSDSSSVFSQSSPPSSISDVALPPAQPRLARRFSSRAEDQVANVSATPNPTCGTTATIILLCGEELFVAHVGDSRAVMSRGGEAVRLCDDHRPGREDEMERIETAGGLILKVGGTYRVNGTLAVSRAIGDRGLKEFVVADPEILSRSLSTEDEFIVVASDGLWDYMTDQDCVDVTNGLLDDRSPKSLEQAAKNLVDIACERGSSDDVSVVVVDLSQYQLARQDEESNPTPDNVESPTVELCLFDLSMQEHSKPVPNSDRQMSEEEITEGTEDTDEEVDSTCLPTPRNGGRQRQSTW